MARTTRRRSIEQELMRRICAGTYEPSSRIPPRRDLQREFGVSPVTLQLALDRLLAEGFLVARGSRGTFVAAHPPNTSRYAVVFPANEGEPPWNRFWATILRVAQGWRDADGHDWATYFIAGSKPGAPAHAQLCADAADGRIAGAFFVSGPGYLVDSPLFAAPLARVIMGEDPADMRRFGASHVVCGPIHGVPDETIFRLFASDRRRRLAVLVTSGYDNAWSRCEPHARAVGLELRRSWWAGLPTDRTGAEFCGPFIRLLFDRPATERPDALFIGDDNLVPYATAALVDCGLSVPRDVSVIAHANLPSPTPSAVPCRRYAIDVNQLLATVLDELDHLRSGGAPRTVRVEQIIQTG